jgi:hypothetical protein
VSFYRGGRAHLFTDARGCSCGSVVVASSEDARDTRRAIEEWEKYHPEGRQLHGAVHGRTTVKRAREIRARRGQEIERSRIEIRDKTRPYRP